MQKLIDFADDRKTRVEIVESRKLVRRFDPATSHDAAGKVAAKVGRLEIVFIRTLSQLGRAASAYEVAATQTEWRNEQSVRKRAGGLKVKGLIRCVDRDGITPDGSACERFELTKSGKDLLNEKQN